MIGVYEICQGADFPKVLGQNRFQKMLANYRNNASKLKKCAPFFCDVPCGSYDGASLKNCQSLSACLLFQHHIKIALSPACQVQPISE